MNYFNLKGLKVATIALFVLCATANVSAQTKDSLLRVYDNETIHSFGRFYIKGSRQLTFRDLKPEFNAGITKDLYKKSKGNLILSRAFTVTSLAALISGALTKKSDKGTGIALGIAGIGLNLASLRFRKQSTELIDRALWLKNKEILFGVQ